MSPTMHVLSVAPFVAMLSAVAFYFGGRDAVERDQLLALLGAEVTHG